MLLVPSLRVEGWKAMDRYADALMRYLPAVLPPGWSVARQPDLAVPRCLRYPSRWLMYPKMVDWDGYDVVHVLDHSYAHVLYGRKPSVRTVLTVHDLYALEFGPQRRGIRGAVVRSLDAWVLGGIRQADVCLCDSTATLEALVRWDPATKVRGRVEFLGVEDHFFIEDRQSAREEGRRLLNLSAEAFVILHVGSCVPRKNLGAIFRALRDVQAEDRTAVFVQVGGSFTREQRREFTAMQLRESVMQVPGVAEELLPRIYAAADVLVLPSLFEGFGFPVLEAFAAEVPVAASRNWSLRDFPDHLLESAGSGSGPELAEAILRLKKQPDAVLRRSREAREWARQWTWQRVAKGAAAAYGAQV